MAKEQILKRRRKMNFFFVGAAAGLVTGLLVTPKTGAESRRKLSERFSSASNKVMRRVSIHDGRRSEGEGLESTMRADYLH